MLIWDHRIVQNKKGPDAPSPVNSLMVFDGVGKEIRIADIPPKGQLETWLAEGGDAMALIALKEQGYELVAWWTNGKGQLTPADNRPVFPTLEEAQAEANRLVFSRTADWSRLLEDSDDAP